jgi:hypothetical protein
MTTRLSGIALAGLIAALGAMACGGDDSGDKASPSKSDDKDDTVKGSKECGPTICKPEKDFMGELCCKSNFDGTCGQMVAGSCTDLPPPSDKRCKPTTFMAGGSPVNVPSCCTANNECGLVFNAGIGAPMCTSLAQAKMFGARFMAMGMMGTMMFNFTGNLPDPVTCDGDPIETPAAGAAGSAAAGAAGSGM